MNRSRNARIKRLFASIVSVMLVLGSLFFWVTPAHATISVDGNIDADYAGHFVPVTYASGTFTGKLAVVETPDAYFVAFEQDHAAKSNAYCARKKGVAGCYQTFAQLLGSDYISFTWTLGGRTIYVPVDILVVNTTAPSGYAGMVGGRDGGAPSGIPATAVQGTSALDYDLNVLGWRDLANSPNFAGQPSAPYVYGSIVEVRIDKSGGSLASGLDLTHPVVFAHNSPLAPMPPLPPPEPRPSASVTQSCSIEGGPGAVVALRNEGDAPAAFTVAKDGVTIDSVTVQPNDVTQRVYVMAEDETATFSVASTGMATVTQEVTNDCAPPPGVPSATVTQACAPAGSGAVIALRNQGGSPVTFTVLKDGAAIDSVTVQPGENVQKSYTMTEDEVATFTVTSPDMTPVSRELKNDCFGGAVATAAAVQSCAFAGQSGAVVTLNNSGDLPAVFTVRKDGVVIDTVTVVAASHAVRAYDMAEDESATYSISAAGMRTVIAALKTNCVLGEQFHRTTPKTGVSDHFMIGGLLALVAAAMVSGALRHKH